MAGGLGDYEGRTVFDDGFSASRQALGFAGFISEMDGLFMVGRVALSKLKAFGT